MAQSMKVSSPKDSLMVRAHTIINLSNMMILSNIVALGQCLNLMGLERLCITTVMSIKVNSLKESDAALAHTGSIRFTNM